ncbi:unnamed protein product [Euphydryas editha]|uniref:Lipocalin/cytosolic fatty-acid binding domain-containing protein n=1 Tax=Euphydryas editha TaxID=104508 RepID=A0AAU9UAK3_EUPED|nr:unnamed protein product [Euphydryas editha]
MEDDELPKTFQFLGQWYIIRRTENPTFTADCANIEFSEENNTISFNATGVNENFLEEARGNAVLESGTAKFTITANSQSVDFWIIMTDYENYAVAYSCVTEGNQSNVYIWLLGRTTSFPTQMMEALINQTLFRLFGVNINELRAVDHSELACRTLPEIPPGQPIILPGLCDENMPVVQNFNVAAFLGTWHQIASYYTINQVGTCNRAQYSLSNNAVAVTNSEVVNQTLVSISGNATVSSTDNSARLLVTLEVQPGVYVQSSLWILATDYTNYAVSYTCVNLPNNQRTVNSWIVSRTKQLNPQSQEAVNELIRSNIDLNNRFFIQSDHSDDACFYYPEPESNRPVVFRGQCDPNIPAMPAFNAARYLGLWHNIESYPSTFQPGTCNNAYYELAGDVVNVFNTQVINQTLDTINGVATVVSDDGSAKLSVVFPVIGNETQTVETDYWVLDTDYDSYALVYSCQNISDDERLVFSWKLSRTKQMPNAGTTAINNIIANISILDQRYFETNDQSREGCFYFPEPQPGVPVRFPGQCDNNTQVVTSFNLTQFQGLWYEVQAYPKEQQPGQCVSHEFTLNGGNFDLVTSSVSDQFLGISNNTATLDSNDGSAKMTITIRNGNTEIRIPYWILDTDYTNYALAYSCVNVDNDFQMIYSWKLSRTNQLSPQSNNAINNVISRETVLDQRYYENVDQSNSACFYLPEIPPGQPVILNGQCDPNISVVQNFSAGDYIGRWRLIESYASEFQNGTCIEANYNAQSDGSVEVVNTQVIDQTLRTEIGSAVLATTDNSGKLLVTFPSANAQIEYWILDTDYTSYSLVYSCVNLDNQRRRVWSWKLSRTRNLTPTAIENMNRIINGIEVLNNRYYQLQDQSDAGCFYYPTPEPNRPVTFRGQCDPDINVVTNFEAGSYLGLWYNIQSYPSEFQPGTCNNALYSLGDGVVDVYNTQVIDQRLDYIHGVARISEAANIAKLDVTFPVAGTNQTVETPYWVLATDYTNYALVYSCLNIDSEQFRVWSWKLSRTKQLTPNAVTAINNIVNTIPVLNEQYYYNNDQSVEGCFYFPEPEPGVPVVFPGQCDQNIQAVPNFNMNSFQGTWYEIQAYPKEQQTGQCINHQYSFNNSVLNLVSSSVTAQILDTTNSVVTFASAQDTSGKLTITLNNNGTDIIIPFWVLETNYNDYALAYSCVNVNSTFRSVYSWKLSRSTTLSAAGNTAINNRIDQIDVLNNTYYENINQTDDACFYLPEPIPNQPVEFIGQCDDTIPVVQNFNISNYMGRWRLIQSYPQPFQTGTCNQANYEINSNGLVDVYNTQVVNQQLDSISGTAAPATNDGSAKFLVTFPNSSEPAPYWVLDTDYDSYALIYSCRNLPNNRRRVSSWKLSRTPQLTPNANQRINEIVNRINVLNDRYYATNSQSDQDCFYLPTPDFSRPVTFRGQCDENIPVVSNFNAANYLGLWYSIQSYPSEFQPGTCNNALYSLGDGVVDVYNTQVIDQRLDTIHGVARISEAANIAKLDVTFPVAGTNLTIETPYWILATDYTSYSLVYTCINVDSENRRVWSWKLSRTKQLTPNAVTAINNIVNTIPVLNEQYYYNNDQSVEGCFYFPEPEPGVPVVFPGQCDQNIQAVPNFNMNSFQGTWYEIQAYPKEQQTGQCINHQYSFNNSVLNLVSSSVTAQILDTTNSVVTFASAQDTSGKLTITLNNNGTDIIIPFWVLETNYNDYALAYSCVNVNSTFRSVYSWKLSRSTTLSAVGNTAINNRIDQIDVLNNTYYENIDQTDDACFYLPESIPNQPVDFVGQCDETIPVVQNFNISNYMGRWRMIQSYPQASQTGTCNQANYEINSNGLVDVYNTQVVNEQLDSISGTAAPATNDGSAKFLVTFPTSSEPAPYWVLDTDYDSYALIYSCRNLPNNRRRVTSWKLSRTPQLTPNANQRINEIVNRINVLNDRYYAPISQSEQDCFYLPTPDFSRPVTFRGQCDENIPVVSNFNAANYLGLWYSIQSYPSEFQPGTCNNALYSLGDGVVDVYNTQVIDQRLDTIHGVARISEAANIAKLDVTFPVAGTNLTIETPYWVLATDYTSYSLVYTCINVDSENRRVWSWKLSRTKQLTPNAFQGTWYEIQAYPKEQQTGQCINHQYSFNNSVLNLVSSSVSGQILDTTNSVVTFASTQDTSGKLTITLNNNGTEIIIPFWVLETNYNDYALAYSCVNVNSTFRSVYSWKLSRSKTLSPAGNTAINNRIDQIDVLNNTYYENIDQSDNACFYLPDISPGEPVVFNGQCDLNIPVVQNFRPQDYTGRWRMIETYASEFQSLQSTCSDASYTLNSNGIVDVYNTQVINQTLDTINGTATLATTDGSAKLLVNFPGAPEPSDYWVLDTDYTSFALVYSCRNINDEQRRVWTWKLSRTTELTAAANTRINQVISGIDVLNERYYIEIDHSDDACFYYPTPDGNPVIFRGQCDENITVVNNFNAQLYGGTWYDIESYPVNFQDGTCPTATYTLTSTGVDVYNTQVVNQQLDTINGFAVLATNDGQAKLNVSFPIAGTNLTAYSPYWILATDYIDYALVYSCVNIDSEYRRVSSWKLSRERTLSPSSAIAINNAINSVPVLRHDYYVTRGHTDVDCFYYPDNNGGPVVQNGQCNFDNLTVVSNFNSDLFSGPWYEVSRFPSELQEGECVSNEFVANNQELRMTMTIVSEETQSTFSGSATLVNSSQGILDVNLVNNNGETFQTRFYVLGVDYNDYALFYNCREINATSKQVYSWKLSRSQSGLSQAAINNINNIVSNTDDLFEGYYDNTDQTVNGCFHYPEFEELPPAIELIGPCDESINAKANFSVADYLGEWYEIASYPQAFQEGTCARAQYSLGTGSVNVFNTQVINRTLDVQTATAVVASTDGSGLLNVTFQLSNGVTNVVNYYVLETDYTSFALVYSCRNLPNGGRQVSSWQLSRSTTMPAQALPIINNLIENTQGLNQNYYQLTDQSPEACFYIPEVNRNEAPRFRGQCENIQGIQDFDIQRFVGWWHEIESYPTDYNRGTCYSSEIRQSGNDYIMIDTGVFGTSAEVNTSTVSADSNGRLRKTYDNGQSVDVWVLATDYETYALLYSCENVDEQYRRVWSAKYSKTRELSNSAQSVMSPIIEATETLESQFYLPADQSDEACFHYPEPTGNRIILPGQCDTNITVVQNFNPAEYSGTWYQIQRYPQIHENGTCVGARYTLNEDTGVVTVLNWQVTNGVLDTVEGTATVNSTDGSAKLMVNLPIRGTDDPNPPMVSMELYVLTTDYTSYSLAYSCVNVGPYHRAIGAWKLSRTRSLTTAGNDSINSFMGPREELLQRYFENVEQQDDCDEPSSAVLFRSSIIIILICSILHRLL